MLFKEMTTGRKTGRLTRAVLAAVVFLSVCATVPAYADIFKYEDEEGVLHITNVPSNPNAKYVLIMKEKRVQFSKNIDFRKYDKIIARVARENNLDVALIKAVIRAESNFDHKAVSRKGAKGLMQLMPQTASSLNVEDVFHPDNNIEGGARYLRYLINIYRGDLRLALAAYNAGEGAVAKYGDIPPYRETQNYVQRVMDFYEYFSKS
jgi:soluble lytic murein transglycosylase-like protein